MSTIRKSPDGRFHVITLSAAEVEKAADEEMKLAAQAASERLVVEREINNNSNNSNSASIFEIERAERDAKAKIASIQAWNSYAASVEATGKALAAWEANKGKRKARISQWVLGIK